MNKTPILTLTIDDFLDSFGANAPLKLPIPLLAVVVSLLAIPSPATPPSATDAALLEQGKNMFVTRCAKCHENDANKKLPDGTTLLRDLQKLRILRSGLEPG